MLRPKQLFVITYVNVCVTIILTESWHRRSCENLQNGELFTFVDITIKYRRWFKCLIWSSQTRSWDGKFTFRNFSVTEQDVIVNDSSGRADYLNVSRITMSRLIIRFRQTDRTNDRPCSGKSRVTSQREDRHLRLIHLQNRIITGCEASNNDVHEPKLISRSYGVAFGLVLPPDA
jgi:hypothetical protein